MHEAASRLADGKPQLLLLRGRRICLIRSGDEIFAIQDSCTHSGEPLSKGSTNYLGEVVCPGHGYCFSPKTGREAQERSSDLETFPVRADDSGVYVSV